MGFSQTHLPGLLISTQKGIVPGITPCLISVPISIAPLTKTLPLLESARIRWLNRRLASLGVNRRGLLLLLLLRQNGRRQSNRKDAQKNQHGRDASPTSRPEAERRSSASFTKGC